MRMPWTALAVIAVGLTLTVALARAQAPEGLAEVEPVPTRLRCQTFETPLDGAELDTHDLDSPAGQWLERQEATGWTLAQIDFEIGQKPTGFAQGFTQICVTPRMR